MYSNRDLLLFRMEEDSMAFRSSIVREIREALDNCGNQYVHTYNRIRDTLHSHNPPSIKLRILGKRGRDGRRYNLPTASEVAALIVGDFDGENPERDVIVETQSGLLKGFLPFNLLTGHCSILCYFQEEKMGIEGTLSLETTREKKQERGNS